MIHLDVKTDYSFLRAYGNPEQIFTRAKEIGATSIGIADIGGTWGHIPFWKASKKNGIKLLFGVQLPLVGEVSKDTRYDLGTIIANSSSGLEALYDAVTLASQQFYFRPRLTWSQFADIPGCTKIVNQLSKDSETHLRRAGDKVYLGAAPRGDYTLKIVREGYKRVALMCSPLYPEARYREAYQLVNSIGSARKTFDIDPVNQWIFRADEVISKFSELGVEQERVSEWLLENQRISDSCDVIPIQARNIRPNITRTLEEWCEQGARERGIDLTIEPYKTRVAYELGLIHQKGFDDYFKLIADLVAWAKDRMFVGPARGSSAGSLVCYLMGIVEVNPITFNLMFERFIDVTRTDLPDVDIDFPDERRDEIFTYLASEYGADRVARLGTISVFKSKSSIGDVAKSYSIPKWETDKLTDVLVERSGGDARANMTIEDTIQQFEVARDLVKKYPKLRMAEMIEGHARHTGKHAAGVVISDDKITKYCSIDHYKNGIAEITKYDAEAIGLMKIDALGLKTLSVLQDCCEMIGKEPTHLYTILLDDKKVFELFQADKVAGIFQFEGYAVRSLMRQMGVEEFNDIVALTSLARPGPLHSGSANEFIARRIGQKDWDYIHPALSSHTSHTYGTIVFQEQVMSITRDLGGMDWEDVNQLRRAMSKSLGEEFFNKYRDKFLIGTRRLGIDDKIALVIWNDMCTFGSWAFNLSHAVSYALVSYWCAYLKTYHPLEFAVAHLRRAASDDHTIRLLRELDKEGIEIVPFDAFRSDVNWSAIDGKVYGGFTAVKGVGAKSAEKFKELRDADPDTWIEELSAAQRAKLLSPNNTPWHNLKRLHTEYAALYSDPVNFKTDKIPNGIDPPVVNIEDITERRGNYAFVATLKARNLRDLNETQSLAKRDGRMIHHNNLFLNLQFEDDTGSILCTINRWNYNKIGKQLMEEESDGKDFFIRGSIMKDGWRKIDIERIVRLN